MWLENLRLLEKATPKSFSEFVKFSTVLDLPMLSSVLESLLWPDLQNSITLHFSTLNIMLQAVDQSDNASRSRCSTSRLVALRMVAMNLLSSANILMIWLTSSRMSLMYMTKRSGPRTLPRGTPLVTSLQSATCWPMVTRCFRSERKSLIQFTMLSSKPYAAILAHNEAWHTLSNALANSRNTTSTLYPLSMPSLILSTVSNRFVIVDLLSTKPCCSGAMRLPLNRWSIITSFFAFHDFTRQCR